MPEQSWKTKTELNLGALSGNAKIIGTEEYPGITVYTQKVRSADTDIIINVQAFNLDSTPGYIDNLIPQDPTPFNLDSTPGYTDNLFPNIPLGDLSSFKSTGNIQTLKGNMKVSWVV